MITELCDRCHRYHGLLSSHVPRARPRVSLHCSDLGPWGHGCLMPALSIFFLGHKMSIFHHWDFVWQG